MAERYTNIKVVLDKVMRHPLLQDAITFETAIDYAVDFMRIVGVPRMFVDKVECIPIHSYRGALPCDWVSTIQVRDKKTDLCMRYATDSFYMEDKPKKPIDETFAIQGNVIYTSIKDGEIIMSYTAMQLDNDNLPMIPDNSVFTRALESYIKVQAFTILFDMGKITQPVLFNAQQDYSFNVGQCQSEFVKLDLSRAESFFNSFRTLLIRDDEFRRGFKNNGSKEMIKLQR